MQKSLRIFLLLFAATCLSFTAAYAQPGCLSISVGGVVNVPCFGDANGSITVNITAGTPPTAQPPYVVELYFRDSGGGLTQLASLTGVIASSVTFTQGNGTLNQPGAETFGIPANSEIDPGSEYRIIVTSTGSGSVTCRTKQLNGIIVTQPTAPLNAIVNSATPACTPGSGAIAIDVSGGTGTYTYAWTGPTAIATNIQDPTSLNAGTYSLTITDGNLCTFDLTNIVVPGPPTVSLGATPSVCSGTTSSSITYTVTSGSPTLYRIDWNAGGPTDVSSTTLPASPIPITGIPATAATYTGTLFVSDGTCESGGTPISVTVNPLPTATISYASPFCATGSTSVVQTGQTGGNYTSTAGLSINATSGAINLAASTPGAYTVTYSFTNGTCPSTTTANVVINSLPTAVISYTGSPFCASGTANVTQTGQIGGTYSSTAGLSISAATGAIDLAASTPGTYTITYSFTDGTCPNTTTTNIAISTLPVASISYTGSPFCATGIANVTQSGITGGTYSSTAGLSINATTGQINLTSSTAGPYTITYSFTNGTCPNTTTTNIVINALPTATISYSGSPYCATGNASVTLAGPGGGTYSSTPGLSINAGSGLVDLAASTAGTYTVTYSFTDGTCPNTTTTTITITALPTAIIGYSGGPFCTTGTASVTQTGTGGGTYSSTAGLSINSASGEIDLGTSSVGTYTITYSFTDGTCPNTTTANITINAAPTATISYSGSPFCQSGTASVTQTGQGGGTYSSTAGLSINAGNGQVDLTATTPGTYTVTYSFTDGTCSNTTTANITISNPPVINVPATATTICENDAPFDLTSLVSATPPGTGFTFAGSGVSGTMFDPAGLSGTVSITVNYTDPSSCVASPAILTLDVTNALTMVVPTSPVQICQGGGAVNLDSYVSGTTGPFSYSGNPGISGNTFNPAGLTGTQNIIVNYAGPSSCSAPQVNFDFDVVTTLPPINIVTGTTACASAGSIDLTTLVSHPISGGTFTFSGPGVAGPGMNQFDPGGFVGPTTVSVNVTYTLTGCGSVNGTIQIDIEDPATCLPNCFAFTVEIDPQTQRPSCNGGADGVIALKVTAVNTPKVFVYVYKSGVAPIPSLPDDSGTIFFFPDLSEGSYEYRLEDENGTFCVQPFVWEAVEDIQAVLSETEDAKCFGTPSGSVKVTATGSSTGQYFYSINGTDWTQFVSGNRITGLPGDGTYNIRIGGSINDPCFEEVSVTINQEGTAVLDTLYVSPLAGFPAVSYPESPTATRVIGIEGSGAAPYEIQLRLVDPYGVELNPPFIRPWFVVDDTTPLGIPQEQINDLYAGVYELDLRDAAGCEKTYTFIIELDDRIFIPNIFTPNGDDKNETFFIRNLPVSGSKLLVSDRWGKEVYASNNYNPETLWDGGKTPDGVYFYRLQIKGGKTYTGWIEILRGAKP